jgi:hypothetical protein
MEVEIGMETPRNQVVPWMLSGAMTAFTEVPW